MLEQHEKDALALEGMSDSEKLQMLREHLLKYAKWKHCYELDRNYVAGEVGDHEDSFFHGDLHGKVTTARELLYLIDPLNEVFN